MSDAESPEGPVPEIPLAALTLDDRSRSRFDVVVDGLVYPCHLDARPGRPLFVSLNAAVTDEERRSKPVFSRWNYADIFRAQVLCISDPLVLQHPTLSSGWYLGAPGRDGVQDIVDIVAAVCRAIGLDASRVVFYGSSSGGFAALMAASRMERGRAVAINAQTRPFVYGGTPIARLLASAYQPLAGQGDQAFAGPRYDATLAVAAAIEAGRDLRLILCQNIHDERHYEPQFKALIESLMDRPGFWDLVRDHRIMPITYDGPPGHTMEPPDMVRRIIGLCHERLLAAP